MAWQVWPQRSATQDGQDDPRWSTSPPQMVQDGLQDGLRESKTAQDSPRGPPEASQTAPEASK
eukprot:1409711-Pyramimonas_sp.AAC.1